MQQITLKRISVSNFKSYRNIDVSLRNFNVLIGANASGKSNFVNIFRFLKDICTMGLDNAISMQGGVEYIANKANNETNELRVEMEVFGPQDFDFVLRGETERAIGIRNFLYSFSIEFLKRTYKVKEEKISAVFDFKIPDKENEKENTKKRNWKRIKEGKFTISLLEKNDIEASFEPLDIPVKLVDIFPLQKLTEELPDLTLDYTKELKLLGGVAPYTRYYSPMGLIMGSLLSGLSIFDIDPKLCKKASQITGKTRLESDGSNLALALRNVLANEKNKKTFSKILKDLLPFVDSLSVERLADTSVIAWIKESDCADKNFPAPMISDGTINLAALVLALFFDNSPLVVIEEPERNIHPHLISKIIDMMKDASERMNKQIIITTHNPEVIKHVDIENLLLAYRENGYSQLTRPCEKETVKEFLKSKLGVEDLFIQDMLR
jgi:predicted ATPase